MLACPEVDVVRAQYRTRELGIAVRVFQRQPTPGQYPDRASGRLEAAYGNVNRLGPGGRPEHIAVPDERVGEAVLTVPVAVSEAILVGNPFLIDVWIVARQTSHHLATSVIDPDRRAAGVMFGDRGRGDQIKGPRPEAVRRAGQGTDRADLDGVAGEVGLEGFLFVDADLLQSTALDERNERITRDLFGEPRAPRAEHAALAVQQDVGGDVDRLGVGALFVGEPALGVAVRHRLVLQRTLPTLVTNGAVEWMVDQQEFHVAALGLVGDRGGELSLDLHSRRNLEGAGGLRLGDGTPSTSIGYLDQALPASADRVEQRMIT